VKSRGITGKEFLELMGRRNEEDKMVFELRFKYGEYDFPCGKLPMGSYWEKPYDLRKRMVVLYLFQKPFEYSKKKVLQ